MEKACWQGSDWWMVLMPTYDYKCLMCNEIISVVHSIHEPLTKQKCKKCKVEMVRVYSIVGVIFNGSGWAGKK